MRALSWALVCVASAALGCASSTASNWADGSGKKAVVPMAGQEEVPQEGTAGKLREPSQESVPIAGTDLVRGRATVLVNAPIEVVRATVTDYAAYADFMPHYAASRVLGRNSDGSSQVYMKWVTLNGAMKMWARFDMSPVRKDGETEVYSSKLIDGNVKAAKAIWRMTSAGADKTKLSLEVFLHPRLPLPSDLLNEENMKGSVKGVVAMRDRCEEKAQ